MGWTSHSLPLLLPVGCQRGSRGPSPKQEVGGGAEGRQAAAAAAVVAQRNTVLKKIKDALSHPSEGVPKPGPFLIGVCGASHRLEGMLGINCKPWVYGRAGVITTLDIDIVSMGHSSATCAIGLCLDAGKITCFHSDYLKCETGYEKADHT